MVQADVRLPIELSMKQSKKPIRSTLKNIRMFTNQVHRLPNLLNDLSMEVISYVNRTTIVYYQNTTEGHVQYLITAFCLSGSSLFTCLRVNPLRIAKCYTN